MIYSTVFDKRLFSINETILTQKKTIREHSLSCKMFDISNIIIFNETHILSNLEYAGIHIEIAKILYDAPSKKDSNYVIINGNINNNVLLDIISKYSISSIIINRDNIHNKNDLIEFPLFCKNISLLCRKTNTKLYVKGCIFQSYILGNGINRSELSDAAFIKSMNAEPIFICDSETSCDLLIDAIDLYKKIRT